MIVRSIAELDEYRGREGAAGFTSDTLKAALMRAGVLIHADMTERNEYSMQWLITDFRRLHDVANVIASRYDNFAFHTFDCVIGLPTISFAAWNTEPQE